MFRSLLLVVSIVGVAIGVRCIPAGSDAGKGTLGGWDEGMAESPGKRAYEYGELFGELYPQNQPAKLAAKQESVLTGQIVDDKGNPVPGVTVKLWSGMGTRFAGQTAVTGPDGFYRFDPLRSGGGLQGRYYPGIQIEHADYVSADGESWWDVEVPFGQLVIKDFTLVRGGRIAGALTFGSGKWNLREFPLRFTSVDNKRSGYATTGGGAAEFTSPCLYPGEYDVSWNSAYPQSDHIIRVKVEAGKTTYFKANCLFEFKAEVVETPVVK